MTNKINMTELLADREAGTDEPGLFLRSSKPPQDQRSADYRRCKRLPDLEAAFIEMVGALKSISASFAGPEATIARVALEKICHDQ